MASGVTAKVLHVDLTTRQTRVEEIPEITVRKYLGGGALACHLLHTGIAGERGVRFAAIVNQLKHFHGRGGLGAVMGAKNLKAIVARGTKPPTAADKDKAKGQLVWFKEHYDRAKDRFHQLGSSSGVLALEASGILPTRNFRDGSFEGARAISGQTMRDTT